jgi:hypothetical protein
MHEPIHSSALPTSHSSTHPLTCSYIKQIFLPLYSLLLGMHRWKNPTVLKIPEFAGMLSGALGVLGRARQPGKCWTVWAKLLWRYLDTSGRNGIVKSSAKHFKLSLPHLPCLPRLSRALLNSPYLIYTLLAISKFSLLLSLCFCINLFSICSHLWFLSREWCF